MATLNENLKVNGDISADTMQIPNASIGNSQVKSNADISREKMALESNAIYPVPLSALRVHDSFAALLPAAGTSDDLGIDAGTLGTNAPRVRTGDLKAAGATTRYTRFQCALPPEYDDGQTVTLRVSAGMLTTVADTTATLDAQVYECDRVGGVSSDLCATAAQSINSVTLADYEFEITPTDLVAGDALDIRLAVAVNDAATGTVVEGVIAAIELLVDIRG